MLSFQFVVLLIVLFVIAGFIAGVLAVLAWTEREKSHEEVEQKLARKASDKVPTQKPAGSANGSNSRPISPLPGVVRVIEPDREDVHIWRDPKRMALVGEWNGQPIKDSEARKAAVNIVHEWLDNLGTGGQPTDLPEGVQLKDPDPAALELQAQLAEFAELGPAAPFAGDWPVEQAAPESANPAGSTAWIEEPAPVPPTDAPVDFVWPEPTPSQEDSPVFEGSDWLVPAPEEAALAVEAVPAVETIVAAAVPAAAEAETVAEGAPGNGVVPVFDTVAETLPAADAEPAVTTTPAAEPWTAPAVPEPAVMSPEAPALVQAQTASVPLAPLPVAAPDPEKITSPLPSVKPAAVKPEPKTKVRPPTSIVAQIDEILQEQLTNTALQFRGIRLAEDASHAVIVLVGADRFDGMDAVKDPEVRAAIRKAVAEWEHRNDTGRQR